MLNKWCPINTSKVINTEWLNKVQINQSAKGAKGANGGKGEIPAGSTDDLRVLLGTSSS